MDFIEKITQFSKRIERIKGNINTEEATKTAVILPFFQLLGYDVFNPFEFVPEFTADAGSKKGEKVDYAIMIHDAPLILIEAKPINTELSIKHINQLLRYFTVTNARFGILTNGIIYRFYSDLEEPNKMDTIPFFEFDLLNIRKDKVEELRQFQKDTFDMKNILGKASDLKYMTMIKKVISDQFSEPSDTFVKALITKNIYNGTKTQAVLDKFRIIVKKAIYEYINDLINERISTAITQDAILQEPQEARTDSALLDEEVDILNYIKKMLHTNVDILYKKTSRYAYMQIGEYSTKWICRIYIRKSQHLFTLHKFENTDYECEYYFDTAEQLNAIKDIIIDTFNKCCNL